MNNKDYVKKCEDLILCKSENQLNHWIEKNKKDLFISEKRSINLAIVDIMRLKTREKASLYSQADLAVDIGVDRSTINRFLNGSRHPNKYIWYKVALLGKFSYEQLEEFMAKAGYKLNIYNSIDAILIYCNNNRLSINQIYALLIYYKAPKNIIDSIFPEIK